MFPCNEKRFKTIIRTLIDFSRFLKEILSPVCRADNDVDDFASNFENANLTFPRCLPHDEWAAMRDNRRVP